jgi:hypothetical protein
MLLSPVCTRYFAINIVNKPEPDNSFPHAFSTTEQFHVFRYSNDKDFPPESVLLTGPETAPMFPFEEYSLHTFSLDAAVDVSASILC